jgi:hypothetical protein
VGVRRCGDLERAIADRPADADHCGCLPLASACWSVALNRELNADRQTLNADAGRPDFALATTK